MHHNHHSMEEHHMLLSRLDEFYELLECNYTIAHWCYADDGHLISGNSPDARILDIIFSVSLAKSYMVEYGKEHTMPLVISSSLGNIWIVIVEPIEDFHYFHMLGPLFTDSISRTTTKEMLDFYQIPLSWKKNFEQLISTFPTAPWNIMSQYTIMLHYLLTGEKISTSDFNYYGAPGHSNNAGSKQPATPSAQTIRSEENESMIWNVEQLLLDNVRSGNLQYQSALSLAMASSSGVAVQTGNPLRQAKDSGIVFCALCARAAIEGGMSASTAYMLQNMYSQNIENVDTVSDVAIVNHQMYADFIARVHKLKELPAHSLQITRCIEYIQNHLNADISLKDMAAQLGYSDYYLTRKFKQEVRLSLNQYIRQEKLKAAEHLLGSTNLSVQEISDQLCFCSRSYFTDIFTKTYGETPSSYRAKHRR